MALKIAGKTIDLKADAPAPAVAGERIRVAIEHLSIHVMMDGKEILKATRTVDNIELVADLLSAYGYPDQATQLRREGKRIPRSVRR